MLKFLKQLFDKPVPTYTFDITGLDIYSGTVQPSSQIVAWLDAHVYNWQGKLIWLHDPVASDIAIYRIYFPNRETLTQFKLTWQKGEL